MLRSVIQRALSTRELFARNLSTRRHRRVIPPVVDIESQLADLPPDQRKQILSKAHGQQPPVESLQEVCGDDFTANLIIEYLESAETPADLDSAFWASVKGLMRSASRQKTPEYLEIGVALFQAAKSIEQPRLRNYMLYTLGRYIYGLKQVRMDPVNEVEFLDSLVARGHVFRALHYWRSRLDKPDVHNSVYWLEVGALYHLEAGLVSRADAIAAQIQLDHGGYVPPRVLTGLIGAYAGWIRRGRNVDTAKNRLDSWTNVLLQIPFYPESIENEDASLEEKLQEVKPASAADLQSAFMSLVAARQWALAAVVAKALGSLENTDIFRAFETAETSSMHNSEEDIAPLLEILLAQDPQRVAHPRLGAAVALSFARSQNVDDLLAVLNDLQAGGIELPDSAQRHIARAVMQNVGNVKFVETHLPSSPAAQEVVKRLMLVKGKKAVADYARSYQGERSTALDLQLLRTEALEDQNAILDLGTSGAAWMYIWYLIAANKTRIGPATALKAMLERLDEGTFELNDELWIQAAQSIIVASPSVADGAATALAMMLVVKERHKISATPLLSTAFLETLRKVEQKGPTPFTRPRAHKLRAHLVDSDADAEVESEVQWDELVRHCEATLADPKVDLGKLARDKAHALSN